MTKNRNVLSGFIAFAICLFLYSYASIYSGGIGWKYGSGRATGFRLGGKGRTAAVGDVTDLVNVFIGTTGPGHVFPGATRPHGMVKVGMDTDSPDNHAGYDADPRYLVTGFSQLHEDGTGGAAPLSNFKLFPLAGCPSSQNTAQDASALGSCPTRLFDRKTARALKASSTPVDSFAPIKPGENAFEGAPLFGGRVADDEGRPGYFAARLASGVRVELTATRRTALHRYTFPAPPAGSGSDGDASQGGEGEWDYRPRIIVDMTNDGARSGYRANARLEPERGRLTGGARFRGSFGPGSYNAFVCVDFRAGHDLNRPLVPTEFGTYAGSKVAVNKKTLDKNTYSELGAIFTFAHSSLPSTSLSHSPPAPLRGRAPSPVEDDGTDEDLATDGEDGWNLAMTQATTTILARVGVSFISTAQACTNAETEIPDFDFERVRESAHEEWEELLGRVEVHFDGRDSSKNEVGGREDAVLFYSSLYRSHIVPADYSEENPLWDSSEPYYDSLYCNWDTYRTLFPLMSLHDPLTFARIVRSFIDVQQHEGWLPECRSATLPQFVQGGSSGDPILAEFYVKFAEHAKKLGVSPLALYGALLADAEVEPKDWRYMGRQVNLWKQYGYIPSGMREKKGMDTRQVSRTLEYAFNDFTISQVARELGYAEDWQKYQNRSRGWENIWNPEMTLRDTDNLQEVEGVRGFMQPRYGKNDSFGYTDPRRCTIHDPRHSTCYLDAGNQDGFYEGGSIVYSQYVPHDTARLVELQGGKEAFIRRLDYIFDNDYFDSTNEPSQQIPFMYHYADRPGLSTERSRETIAKSFGTGVDGLPGNDDSGAMGSFVAFHMLGLYPLPGTRELLISSPFFRTVRIHNPLFGTTTTIKTHVPRGAHRKTHVYVKDIHINGDPWHSRCYIVWRVFELGGTIDLELTDDRTLSCGHEGALPPSLSTGGYEAL